MNLFWKMSCESFLSFLVGVEMEWGVFDRFLFYSFYFNLSFLFVIVPTTLTKSLTHSLILKITGSLTLKNFFIPCFYSFSLFNGVLLSSSHFLFAFWHIFLPQPFSSSSPSNKNYLVIFLSSSSSNIFLSFLVSYSTNWTKIWCHLLVISTFYTR